MESLHFSFTPLLFLPILSIYFTVSGAKLIIQPCKTIKVLLRKYKLVCSQASAVRFFSWPAIRAGPPRELVRAPLVALLGTHKALGAQRALRATRSAPSDIRALKRALLAAGLTSVLHTASSLGQGAYGCFVGHLGEARWGSSIAHALQPLLKEHLNTQEIDRDIESSIFFAWSTCQPLQAD